MMVRFMRLVGRLVVGHPGLVATFSLVLTLFLYANIHNLRTGTDLTDLFGNRDPQWRAASQIGKELGYGNQLFVLIEAPAGETDATGEMEEMADRLTADMMSSGLFKQARCGLQEEELLNMVRFFTWNFPSFVLPEQTEDLKRRLDPQQIHQNCSPRRNRTGHAVLVFRNELLRCRSSGPDGSGGAQQPGVLAVRQFRPPGDLETGSSARTTRRCSLLPSRASRPWTTSSPSKSCNGRATTSSR
jgi:hypothetical protein